MAFFPCTMPAPEPDPIDSQFWEHCAKGRLRFQHCSSCRTPRHPPTPICPACHSTESDWIDPGEKAEIFTYTVIHHASHPAVGGSMPYVVAVVTFPGLEGVRLVSNVTDLDPAAAYIGMPLELWFDDIGNDMQIPRFRPKGNG